MAQKYSSLVAILLALSSCTPISCTPQSQVISQNHNERIAPKSSSVFTVKKGETHAPEEIIEPVVQAPIVEKPAAKKFNAKLSFGRPTFTERYYNQGKKLSDLLKGHSGQRKIIIDKSARELELYVGDTLIKSYGISLSRKYKSGTKLRSGDLKTPEGTFYVARKNSKSRYHKALVISYPGREDAIRGLKRGIISKQQFTQIMKAQDECREPPRTKLGYLVEIHGGGGGPKYDDSTYGCASLMNRDMEEVYSFASVGCHNKGKPRTEIVIKR